MSTSYEVNITGVYHWDSQTWSVWLTQGSDESGWELVAFADSTDKQTVRMFCALKDRMHYVGNPRLEPTDDG